jgi:hypothetical protein
LLPANTEFVDITAHSVNLGKEPRSRSPVIHRVGLCPAEMIDLLSEPLDSFHSRLQLTVVGDHDCVPFGVPGHPGWHSLLMPEAFQPLAGGRFLAHPRLMAGIPAGMKTVPFAKPN